MSTFDQGLWRCRAIARYNRAIARHPHRFDEAGLALINDAACITMLSSLTTWCTKRGIIVEFKKAANGAFFPDEKRIEINARLKPENQVYCLLHECGHVLIGHKNTNERFGMGYPSSNVPRIARRLTHKCDVIDEELEAWYRGFKLSRRLKFNVDKQRFDAFKSKMIISYMKWALNVGGF